MREENLHRLSYPKTSLNDPWYIKYTFLFKDLENAVKTHATGDVLDIGCGNKPYRPYFEGLINSYTGCDIIQSDGQMADIICPATDIPLADNTKDTVFSTQVIEHVADFHLVISEAYRILRPGGSFIVSAPMTEEHHEEPYDFFRFTRYGFEHSLTKAGFKVLQIVPNGGKWATIGHELQICLRTSLYDKKSFLRSIFKWLFIIFRIRWFISLFFLWLDKVDKDYKITLNFVVVAQKPL